MRSDVQRLLVLCAIVALVCGLGWLRPTVGAPANGTHLSYRSKRNRGSSVPGVDYAFHLDGDASGAHWTARGFDRSESGQMTAEELQALTASLEANGVWTVVDHPAVDIVMRQPTRCELIYERNGKRHQARFTLDDVGQSPLMEVLKQSVVGQAAARLERPRPVQSPH